MMCRIGPPGNAGVAFSDVKRYETLHLTLLADCEVPFQLRFQPTAEEKRMAESIAEAPMSFAFKKLDADVIFSLNARD